MSTENCRLYEKEYPKAGDSVVVKVLRLEAMGAYVALLEYANMEGLILPTELSKRRFRSIHKLIKVGREEVVTVVRVDADKGYVDLSKKRVAPEDIALTEHRYSNAKRVQLSVRQVASKLNLPILEINEKAIWPLYKKYGHAYEGLRIAASDPVEAFTGINCPQEIIDAIAADVKPRFAPQAVKLRARIHCSCSGIEGVNAIKKALLAAEESLASENAGEDGKVQLIASPLYCVLATTNNRTEGVERFQKALDIIKKMMEETPGGEFRQLGEIMIMGVDEAENKDGDMPSSDDSSDDSSDEDSSEEDSEEGSEEDDDEESASDKE